jgi:WhiB family redox-sensing transcriptional regulator
VITELRFEGFNQGACRTPDPEYGYDLHFPVSEAEGNEPQIARAKAVCESCPAITACRTWALANAVDGIWGGMTEDERRAARAREMKRERELAAAQATDEADDEQLPGEEDQPEQPALPTYQTARDRLGRARRALTLAQKAGDTDAIDRAEQRVADAADQFAAVRTQDTAGAVA